jgi:hypothetical protein
MYWRPWIVASALMASLVFQVVLLATEELQPEKEAEGVSLQVVDPLKAIVYQPGNRIENFKSFGLPADMATTANDRATRMLKDRGELWRKKMKENGEVTSQYFCKNQILPERIGALAVLVSEADGVRRVHPAEELSAFVEEDWFKAGQTKDVYQSFVLIKDAREDATVLVVMAVLTGQEDAAIEKTYPWDSSVATIMDQFADTKIRAKLIDYFATMHVLAEIAQGENGVCR